MKKRSMTVAEYGALVASAGRMEHPGDWHMQEAAFAKACSRLGYRLISLADKSPKKKLGFHEQRLLGYIDSDLRAIGG